MNGSAKHPPKWKLEYLTFELSKLHPPSVATRTDAAPALWENATGTDAGIVLGQASEMRKERFVYPVPLKQLPKKLRAANVTASKYAPYKMADLTIPSWLQLARRLGRAKHAKLRKRFRRYMYMGANEEL
jgi:endopolyphosphatase